MYSKKSEIDPWNKNLGPDVHLRAPISAAF